VTVAPASTSRLTRVGSLLFECTWRCNQACAFCYNAWHADTNDLTPTPEPGTLRSRRLLARAIRESGAARVAFTGGEPTLRDDLIDLVATARVAGAKASLLTNGARFDRALAADLKRVGCGLVQLTLCGLTATTHDGLCGAGAFERVHAGFAAARAARLPASLTFVLTRPALGDAEGLLDHARRLGVRQVLVNRFNPGGHGLAQGGADLLPTLAELRAALAALDRAAARTGLRPFLAVPLMPCLVDKSRYPHLRIAQGCAAGTERSYFTLDPLGRVRFCNHTATVLGRVGDRSFATLLNAPQVAAFREARPPFCATCPGWDRCRGGCRAAAEQATGRWDAEDPFLAACLARGEVRPPRCHRALAARDARGRAQKGLACPRGLWDAGQAPGGARTVGGDEGMAGGRGWRAWGVLGAWLVVAAGCGAVAGGQDAGADAGGEVRAEVADASEAVGEALDAAAEADLRPAGPYEVPSGPEDRTFHAGPWLGATSTTSVAVSWQTDAPGDSVVEFGLGDAYGGRAQGPADVTLHEVWVQGLQPETLYHYRACTAGTCTGDLTFATAPLPGRPFRFAVIGDTQTDFASHAQVEIGIRASLPALVLHAGDVVGYGADRESYVTEFFEPARQRGHYVPTFAVPGNHDWKERIDQLGNFRDYFALPADPDVPLPEASYAFAFGDAFFVALDNTLDGGHFFFPLGAKDPPLWTWLQAQVASEACQAARWRFAFFHYPPQSACQETWMHMQATRDVILPLLQAHGFQAVFTGHTHEYEHQVYDRVHVFVTGGGGGGLDTDEGCTFEVPELVFRRSLHHHLTVDLGDEQAVVRALSTEGEEVDRVVLEREPGAGSE